MIGVWLYRNKPGSKDFFEKLGQLIAHAGVGLFFAASSDKYHRCVVVADV
jgi:hypothetical protein